MILVCLVEVKYGLLFNDIEIKLLSFFFNGRLRLEILVVN